MSRTARLIIGGIAAVLILVFIALIYIWVSGGSATPSTALVAPTLAVATSQPTDEPTDVAATDALEATADITVDAVPTAEASADSGAVQGETVIFNIVQDESEVRFILNEVLRGSPNTVTGRTDQVAGQIGVDFANPQNAQVGEFRIDARSLATDNELRNRAIRGQILQSSQDQFEFISFKPTALEGLPTSVTIGQSFEFQLTGDLTIRDITQPVTFDVTVNPVSETRLEGSATATVQRSDYNLIIPNVPGVADVDEAVRLELDFVATAG